MVEWIGRYQIYLVGYPFNDLLKINRVRCRAQGSFKVRVKFR